MKDHLLKRTEQLVFTVFTSLVVGCVLASTVLGDLGTVGDWIMKFLLPLVLSGLLWLGLAVTRFEDDPPADEGLQRFDS